MNRSELVNTSSVPKRTSRAKEVIFHLTQFLLGHGCYRKYLHRCGHACERVADVGADNIVADVTVVSKKWGLRKSVDSAVAKIIVKWQSAQGNEQRIEASGLRLRLSRRDDGVVANEWGRKTESHITWVVNTSCLWRFSHSCLKKAAKSQNG